MRILLAIERSDLRLGLEMLLDEQPGFTVAGALTITMQRDEPDDPTERANWLPTPDGEFYLVLRMYWPKPEALDGTWKPPLVVRVD